MKAILLGQINECIGRYLCLGAPFQDGTPPQPRLQTLQDIASLNTAVSVTFEELAQWIENQHLYGLGCGLVDLSLLASARLTPNTRLWTLDKRLYQLAVRFNVAYQYQ